MPIGIAIIIAALLLGMFWLIAIAFPYIIFFVIIIIGGSIYKHHKGLN